MLRPRRKRQSDSSRYRLVIGSGRFAHHGEGAEYLGAAHNLNAFLAALPKSDGNLHVDPDGSVALIAGNVCVAVTRGNAERFHLRMDMPALAVVPRVMDLISGADVPCRWDPHADGLTVEYAALGDAPALVVVGDEAASG